MGLLLLALSWFSGTSFATSTAGSPVVTGSVAGALPSPTFSLNFDAYGLARAGASTYGHVSLVSGRLGRPAARFYGINDPGSILVPNRASLMFGDGGTIDVWVRIDSNLGMTGYGYAAQDSWAMALIAKSHDRIGAALNLYSVDAAVSGSGYGFASFATYDQSWACVQPTKLTRNVGVGLGEWFRLTTTVSRTTGLSVYVNKVKVLDCPAMRPNFAAFNAQDMYIGRYSDSWYPFAGAVQDLRVYGSALSSIEVRVLP